MKRSLILFLFPIFTYVISYAQTGTKDSLRKITTYHSTGKAQQFVIKSHQKSYALDTAAAIPMLKQIKPEWVLSVQKIHYAVNDPSMNHEGVVIITLNDKKYPEAFGWVQKWLK